MRIHADPAPVRGKVLLEIRIPSELRWMTALAIRLAQRALDDDLIVESEREQLEACCLEALKNAIVHGNGEDPARWVLVRLFREGEEWGISFLDEGLGFSEDRIPDPDDPDFPWKEEGRGIHLMQAFMEKVEYFSGGRNLILMRPRSEN